MLVTICVFGFVILFVVFIFGLYYTDLYSQLFADELNGNSISLPPAPIQPTPTVVVEGIIIGQGAYYDIDLPEIIADVIKVEDGIVYYVTFCDGLKTLSTWEFLNRYEVREQTRISSL